ncbi:sugar ABC transporter permease [Paenibacillus piri]|uniref:Sugar ABC transporter permease n=2 Tax=Paenibacillus piri TaxID=2547395 RepID=A0A4R5KVF6_9BACL|nr:sugar ABC transporter permease [Paenibacillus piri]
MWYAFLFLTPSLIGFLLFIILPTVSSFFLSFFEWDLLSEPRFAGLGNFETLAKDDLFGTILKNTFIFTIVTIPVGMIISFIVAVLLNQGLKGTNLYRTVYFLPVMASAAGSAVVWKWIFEKDFGLLNYFLGIFGINGPGWLTSTEWAMTSVIIMSVWKHIGFDMVIFLAALQGIPRDYYEAADIDGANAWYKARHITIPLVSYSTFFVLIMAIIRSFQIFDQMYILTKGGPGYSTQVLVYYIYTNAFEYFKLGYASAVAWVLFIIILIITLIQMKLQNKWVFYR